MNLISTAALASAILAGILGTLTIEEQTHDRELFAAYCMAVFGPDRSSLKSPAMPACLTNEPADECSARIADVEQERQRVDLNVRQLQESLATQGVIIPVRYSMLAKYRSVVLGRPMTTRPVDLTTVRFRFDILAS